MKQTRILVVDDSAFMRRAIKQMLESDPDIVVIDTARNGIEAIEKTIQLRPDLVTLDIEMPKMNGLEALKIIMEKRPTPVLMVSSLTSDGAKVTLEAMELGALDFIPKNLSEMSVNILRVKEDLVKKVKLLANKKVQRPARQQKTAQPRVLEVSKKYDSYTSQRRISIISIGTSTGGPMALQKILPYLPANLPVGVVIAQHMPAAFTGTFAQRLNNMSHMEIREAVNGDIIKPGVILVAPGGKHMRVQRTGAIETRITISDDPKSALYRPSVNELMLSVAEFYPGRALGVILTGMGNDGHEGIKAIKKSGGKAFAQDEETCVVYGMPRAVVDDNLADKVLPIDMMVGELINAV